MPNIQNVSRDNAPSPRSNHIIIEPVNGGFQASGVQMADQVPHMFSSIVYTNYIDALREAMTWSIEHAIPDIFVIGEADAHRS